MLTGKWGKPQMMAEQRRRVIVVAAAVLLTLLVGLAITLGDADDAGGPAEPERSPESRTEPAD